MFKSKFDLSEIIRETFDFFDPVGSGKKGEVFACANASVMLSAIGIEPKNGWIADYPVTPSIIGKIEKGVAGAADAGKLGMGKAQVLKVVSDLKTKLGLSVSAGATPPSAKQTTPSGKPSGGLVYYITYKDVDKEGVAHYTNRLESVPKEYRGQTETIREEVPQSSKSPVSEESGE